MLHCYRLLGFALTTLILLAATGCQIKEEFFMNPDGTGKVVHTVVSPPETETREARGQLMGIDRQARGVEAWANPFIERTDAQVAYGLTAYFKNIAQVSIGNNRGNPVATKNADGTWTLALSDPPAMSRPASQPAATLPADMDAAVRAASADIKQQLNAPMMKNMAKCKQITIYHLPGPIKASNGFTRIDDRTVSLELDAGKAYAALGKLADDPARLRRLLEAGGTRGGKPDLESPAVRKLLMKDILGVEDPIFVTFAVQSQPLFDYAAEVQKASPKLDTAFWVNAGVLPKTLPAAPKPFDATTFKVTAVNRDPKAFFGPRIEVNVSMTPPAGANVIPLRAELFTAQAPDGTYLAFGEGARAQSFGGGKPLAAGAAHNFTVAVKNDPAITRIGRLTGLMTVAACKSTQVVDAGEIELKEGAKGPKYGLRIVALRIRGEGSNAMREMTIDTDKVPGLGAIKFYDAAGKEVLSIGDMPQKKTERSLMALGQPKPLPDKATVKVTVYEDYQEVDIPFELKDLDVPAAAAK